MLLCARCGKQRDLKHPDKATSPNCRPCGIKATWDVKGRKEKAKKKRNLAEWYQRNKARQNLYYQDRRDKVKREVVEAYGGRCVGCGEGDYIVLTLDHVNDDGAAYRRQFKTRANGGGFRFYMRLKRQGWPQDGLQLLCHNCNYRKEHLRRQAEVRRRASDASRVSAPTEVYASSESFS